MYARAVAETELLGAASGAGPDGGPSLSLVVPVFNERETVEELYRRTVAALEPTGRGFEIVFVDDGSTDGTFGRIEAPPRRRPARPRRALQAQLRPAPGDARRLPARPRRRDRDDGRRPPERARGHPAARRGGRGGGRRRERPARRAARLVGPDAAVAHDQRDAAPVHRRADLRLRLRVQRLPAERGRADARARSDGRSSRRR